MPAWAKDINDAVRTDADGTRWVPPRWVQTYPDPAGALVRFQFRPDREQVPARVRVALYLPEVRRVVVSDAIATAPYLTDLILDLSDDNTASLAVAPKRRVTLVFGLLLENAAGLAVALALTIVLELVVIAACLWFRKGEPVKRLDRTVILGNLITVPLVWFVSVYDKVEPTAFGWPILFILAELSAALFEGWLYYRIARIPFDTALVWSLLANGATFLVGCCLVAFTI